MCLGFQNTETEPPLEPPQMKSWCNRCRRFHDCEPVDPDKIAAELIQQIADEIDAAILNELLALDNKEQSHEIRKTDS